MLWKIKNYLDVRRRVECRGPLAERRRWTCYPVRLSGLRRRQPYVCFGLVKHRCSPAPLSHHRGTCSRVHAVWWQSPSFRPNGAAGRAGCQACPRHDQLTTPSLGSALRVRRPLRTNRETSSASWSGFKEETLLNQSSRAWHPVI